MSKTIEQQVEELLKNDWYNSENNNDHGILARCADGDDPSYAVKEAITKALQERDRIAREEERKAIVKDLEDMIYGEYAQAMYSWQPEDFANHIAKALTTPLTDNKDV